MRSSSERRPAARSSPEHVRAARLLTSHAPVSEPRRVGSQVPERLERISSDSGAPKQEGFLFDDSGTGANNKMPEKGLLKKSKQIKADGTRYAPWMVIDESAVEKYKRERLERKKKEAAGLYAKEKKKGLF